MSEPPPRPATRYTSNGRGKSMAPRGRCPDCKKLGLGKIRHASIPGRVVSFRSCRYCGEQVTLKPKKD